MSQRHSWKFEYVADGLLEPTRKKAAYHREREKWWQAEFEKAQADLRQHGVEMRETPVTGGTRIQPIIDPSRQARVDECNRKMESHRRDAEQYEMFARAFELNGSERINLDAEDIVYFGL